MANTSIEIGALVQVLEAKGIHYELRGNHTHGMWCGTYFAELDTTYAIELGIAIAPGIWAWFTVRGMEDGCANEYWFRQRYNANIGSVLKSFRAGNKVVEKIEKLTGYKLSAY